MDIAAPRILHAAGATDILRRCQLDCLVQQRLDLQFIFVRQLVAVRPEQLDAIVVKGIVAGRDHHAQVRAHRMGKQGDGGRGDRAELHHIHADRRETRNQRIFHHITRQARILADHHAVAMAAALEMGAGCHADLHRQIRGHWPLVGASAYAVGAEILPAHLSLVAWGRKSLRVRSPSLPAHSNL